MTANGVLQLALYVVVLLALARPLGAYMARVYEGRPTGLDRVLGWLERFTYRLCGVGRGEELGWKAYTVAMLLFNFLGVLVVYLVQRAPSDGRSGGVEGIDPAKSREAGEVGVARMELGAVLDRQGREMGVVDEVAGRPEGFEEVPHHGRVAVARMDDDRTGLGEPAVDHVEGAVG